MIKPGNPLPNGALLIAARKQPDAEGHWQAWTVLTINGDEYVTWTFVIPDSSTGSTSYCVHGHYFAADDFADAVSDYLTR